MPNPQLCHTLEAEQLLEKLRLEYRASDKSMSVSERPTDRDIAIHLAVQFDAQFEELQELRSLLDKYREFTAYNLCKGCRRGYEEDFDGIDCESDREDED